MKLKLYMKSGNQIMVKGVEDWRGTYTGNEITQLSVTWENPDNKYRVSIGTIDLSQIEAIETLR